MSDNYPSGPTNLEKIAKDDFEHARMKAFWRSLASWFLQDKNNLIPFDEVRRRIPLRGQHYIGLRQIMLSRIVGSVGRYNDFDRAFLPRQSQTRGRWINIDRAHLQDIVLPPIEVYKIGELYFVKDGNHRVSVARERGQVFIDAYVIEIDISVPVDENTDIEDIILRQERAEFYERTQLGKLHPEAEVELTLPGQYEKLLEHISVHRYFVGEKRKAFVPYEEAVSSWYNEVYLPLVKTIRELGVLKEFRRRTEADLYLWIIEHLWYLRSDNQQEISYETAAVHFAEQYSPHPLRRLINAFRRLARSLGFNDASKRPENGSDSRKNKQ